MESKKIYEYVIVKDYFAHLDKGTRLYYDFNKGGYTYHTEREDTSKCERYVSHSVDTTDYFVNIDTVTKYIEAGELISGPELGELEMLVRDVVSTCKACETCGCDGRA